MKPRLWAGYTAGILGVLLLVAACSRPHTVATPVPSAPISAPDTPLTRASRPANTRPAPTAEEPTLSPQAPLQVLFLGNSLTFSNDLPGSLAALARSGGFPVEVEVVAEGGWTLADHAASRSTRDAIAGRAWDWVVLQEQSALPAVPEERSQRMLPAVRALDVVIRDVGATPVLFMTWGRRQGLPSAGLDGFSAMQAEVENGTLALAEAAGATVAPVGAAWRVGLEQQPELALWQADGLHPSRQGSYLAACVFYTTLLRQSPEGATYVAGLPEETAHFLQAVAAHVVLSDPSRWNLR